MARKHSRNRHAAKQAGPDALRAEKPKEKKTLVGALLQMPQTPLAQLSQIELMSNREALVDGCKGVVEYNEDFIRLNLGSMMVRFCGRSLQLRSMSEQSVVIEGFIQSIDFIT